MSRRARAGCRLHFGLCRVPVGDSTGPLFGGLGLVLAEPAVSVAASAAQEWAASGPLAERALKFAKLISTSPVSIRGEGPPEHVGLGVGTALGLAVARALVPKADVPTLARMAGRGERSGVGVAGFERGGFVLDLGKTDGVPNGCDIIPFPTAWRVVLARPHVPPRWYGAAERAAFATPHPAPPLWDLAADVARAVAAADFSRFAPLLTEFNRRSGEPFAAAQGGVYAGPEVAAAVESLRDAGAACVGQSSWGPTAFAVFPSEREAGAAAAKLSGFEDVLVTRAASPHDYANQADEEDVGDQHQ